jgi:Gpi18-like mannosyltransferase
VKERTDVQTRPRDTIDAVVDHDTVDQDAVEHSAPAPVGVLPRAADLWQRARDRVAALVGPARWAVAVYVVSRLFLLAVAGVVAALNHQPLGAAASRFDGQWYLKLAEHGYPTTALHAKSTLGFFPLYPLVARSVSWVTTLPVPAAALLTSLAGGLVAAVLIQRLATEWWGERAGRRAVLIFCLFPGTVVFSMTYSECVTLPLAIGCMLALRSQRWWIAGLLAGLATAVEPVALVLVPVCVLAALTQIRRRGWRDPVARRSLAAPLLSPLGIGGLAIFFWAWTGTPFAAYLAQHYGWHQQNQPLALLALPVAKHLFSHVGALVPHIFAWNTFNGVFGGVFLVWSIIVLVRVRRELSPGALSLPMGIAAVTLWSILTPPNARMLLIAFPAVLVWGRRLSGRRLSLFVAVETALLLFTSALTFAGLMLP